MADTTGTGSLYPDDGEGVEHVPDFVPSRWTTRHSAWAKGVIKRSLHQPVASIDASAVSWRQAILAVLAGPVLLVILLLFVSMAFATSTALGMVAFVGCVAPYMWIAWHRLSL
jgi:hypothetical protein